MSSGASYYAASILIYFGTWLIATWGFDIQFGMTRVVNLGFIVSLAAGAYFTAALTIGPNAPAQTYVFGASWPFPLPIVVGAGAGAGVSLLLGLLAVWRLRDEYFAIVTLVLGVALWTLVENVTTIFNGEAGLSGVPEPIGNTITPSAAQYWWYVVIVGVGCVASGWLMRRLTLSPVSRVLRAIRDNSTAAEAIGIPTSRVRLATMGLGGLLGGLSGGLLVAGIGAWNTTSWQVFEILVVLAATAVGGAGNWRGIIVGVAVIPILIGQGITFMPVLGNNALLTDNLQFAIVGVIEIAVLAFRPDGLAKERRRRYMPDGRMRFIGDSIIQRVLARSARGQRPWRPSSSAMGATDRR